MYPTRMPLTAQNSNGTGNMGKSQNLGSVPLEATNIFFSVNTEGKVKSLAMAKAYVYIGLVGRANDLCIVKNIFLKSWHCLFSYFIELEVDINQQELGFPFN